MRLTFPDLRAIVELGDVADALLDELPGLYNSLFSTRQWFAAYDQEYTAASGVCVLEDPRHVLVFARNGGTVEILNRTFVIAPADAERACKAIFRALPFAHRVHLHVLFPPRELRLPTRWIGTRDHLMLDLPGSVDDYEASLGRSTRRNLRLYENRLRRAFPDVRTEVIAPGERAAELLDLIVAWKVARFSAKGRTTYWEERPQEYASLHKLLQHDGEVQITTIEGRVAAIVVLFWVGSGACAQEWAHDPQYESLHLGFVSLRAAIHLAIERGAAGMDLLWGNAPYKERFGARHVPSSALSVFPTQAARLHSLGEARQVASSRLGLEWRRRYWQARHQGGRLARGVIARTRATQRQSEAGEDA